MEWHSFWSLAIMNTMPDLPSTTSLKDVLGLLALSLLFGGVLHALRWLRLSREVTLVRKRYSIPDSTHNSDPLRAVRNYHQSVTAFMLSWLPFLAGITCSIGCSLLRDAGYAIYPWLLLASGLLFGLAMVTTETFRQRRIRRYLLSEMAEIV
jgi:hypothetical protein